MTSQFVRWWNENPDRADAIRASRRKRHQDDPAAAEAHRQRCRDYYERKKVVSDRTRRTNKPRAFWINGETVEYWGTGQVADCFQIAPKTLRSWEGLVLPTESAIIDRLHRRWWPAPFVEAVLPLIRLFQARRIRSLASLGARVHSAWATYKTSEGIHEHRAGTVAPTPDDDLRVEDDPSERD